MLGSSDHVVMSYGTFGMWGALLSSGHVIAAKGTSNITYSEVDQYLSFVMCYGRNHLFYLILDVTDMVYCTGRLRVYPISAGKLDIHGHQKYNSP